ncbi:glycoside hydrolase [Podospora aff. communis PSN243]|uniref:chitinase n=1 Tax=Podospora aff. communis PSN243 TaxID=3040156 RepID=A0AAV9GI37_9PEZI|nr:glycoside hydrolase [Podospora aff. communis PSN243]
MAVSLTLRGALLALLLHTAGAFEANSSAIFRRGHHHSSPHAELMARQNDDGTTSCSTSNPCRIGCCGNGGNPNNAYICGTGEDFCGPSCISNCDYKAECNPGGWDPRYVASERCPLNVCCSTFGFCGVSRDFCGDREVPQPRCSENSGTTRKRRIAYYEGWSPGRPCDVMTPLQVPLGFYTHINVAFAFINPRTFRVEAMDGVPNDITRQIASLKGADPGLRVFISLGGWTFNDPGPTRFTFSQIAASHSAQEAFADSLISFMFHYNLDGVDIDWEYPGADDRGGIPADYGNFVTWMNQLRNRLNRSGRKFELTITVPSSYWYLQHFDLQGLARALDWINVMTYDLHGTWDSNSPWIGAVALGHTNLTEIKMTFDLFWRNNIDPDQLVFGVGFYGRSFTMANPNCMAAGCPFTRGANPGPCTLNEGTLSAAEVRRVIAGGNAKVFLDREAAVEIVTWDDDQWISYDDLPTLQMKIRYANSRCIGGVMVWAVDLDDLQYTSTNELARAMGMGALAKPLSTTPPMSYAEDEGVRWW